MSLFLQYPALLGLLALGAVPLLVHLLSRAKPPGYKFSNIEFLRKVLKLSSRMRRPKDWLLLILRTLAILAIAAAFIHPLLLSESTPLPGEKRTVVCIIDRSGSMAAHEDAASRFDAACAEATQILSSRRPELANVIWLDAQPNSIFPEVGPNVEFLKTELSQAKVSSEPNAIEAAFDKAAEQFKNANGRRELVVISDFQASAWENVSPVIPDNVELDLIQVATEDIPNISVSSLVPVPASPLVGRDLLVQCTVSNRSEEARGVSLTLDAGGSRQSQRLELPARGAAEATFSVHCSSAGLLPITAEIDADGFPVDDKRHAVVRVRETLRMAVLGDSASPEVETIFRFASAHKWLEALTASNLGDLPACDLLIIPEWDGTGADSLTALADSNTAIIVFPSAPKLSVIGKLLSENSYKGDNAPALRTDGAGWEIAPETGHEAFALFSDGEFGNPLSGRFQQRLVLPAPESATLMASYSDGIPAMIASSERPIILSNFPIDPAKNTWVGHQTFIYSLAEIILHLCPSIGFDSFITESGQPLIWTAPMDDLTGAPKLGGLDEENIELTSTTSPDGTVWKTKKAPGAGLYQWSISDQPVHYSAVNFPDSESILTSMPQPPAIGDGDQTTQAGTRLAALDEGLPLWPWLIVAALVLLLLESFIAAKGSKPVTA